MFDNATERMCVIVFVTLLLLTCNAMHRWGMCYTGVHF